MKQGVVIAVWALGALLVPLAAAAGPAPADAGPRPVTMAERVFDPVNRSLFRQCAGGREAAALLASALLAQSVDDAALASADAAFARCTRTSVDPDGVAAAELGIAATAYLAAERSTGAARLAALGRAADYAERADERWRSWHHVGLPGVPGPARVETVQGTDAVERVEVGLPGEPVGTNGYQQYGRVPDPRPPRRVRPTSFDALALGLEDDARAQRAQAGVATR